MCGDAVHSLSMVKSVGSHLLPGKADRAWPVLE